MNDAQVLLPMLALVGWTMTMLLLVGWRRLASRLQPREFALGEPSGLAPAIALPNRNFMNLLEVPTLFYVVCLSYYVTRQVTPAVLALAWAFVALRVAHSLVHVTYNKVMHRFAFFAAANVVLMALWVLLLVRLV